MNASSAGRGSRSIVGRRSGDLGIGVVFQDEQQRELVERARRKRALRRKQPHVARDFAATEEIHQWGAKTGIHDRRVNVDALSAFDQAGRVGRVDAERDDLAGPAQRADRRAVEAHADGAGVPHFDPQFAGGAHGLFFANAHQP